MAHILKNKDLEIHIDLPLENYNFSRFDWTGKIVKVKFQDVSVSSSEKTECENDNHFGKGFYNEFGIDSALGFDEAEIGGWFQKIGVGLLKKDNDHYDFYKTYEIKPAHFDVNTASNKIEICCESDTLNGYSYLLKKVIELDKDSFIIKYNLKNTGEKLISTDEYTHNFVAINNDFIGSNYTLKFPFQLQPELFIKNINPEHKVIFGSNDITFSDQPEEQFFFSNLSGNKIINGAWQLANHNRNIGISGKCSFKTDKVNLWGWKHVISPELFFKVNVNPGQSSSWSRTYSFYNLK
jgi:hypothetical protein